MKFKDLSAFSHAGRVAALSNVRPEFSSVRVDVTGSSAAITVCSDGVAFRTSVPVLEVDADVSFSVPGVLASETFRHVEGGEALLEVDDEYVRLSAGRSRYRMRRTSVTDAIVFPEVSSGEATLSFSIDRAVLFDALSAVSSAAAADSSLAALSSVRLEVSDSGVSMVATDSFRLAAESFSAPVYPPSASCEVAVGARELALSQRIFGRTGDIKVTVPRGAAGWVEMSDGVSDLRFTAMAVQFPQWRRLLEAQPPHVLKVDSQELMELLAKVGPYGTNVRLDFTSGVLSASADDDQGDVTASMDAAFSEDPSEDLSVSFRRSFLVDAVRSMPSGEIEVRVGSGRSPLWLVSGARRYLVMPRTS